MEKAATEAKPAVSVHAALLASGPSGAVERASEAALDDAAAVALLQAGHNIVVCGDTKAATKAKAKELTIAGFGGYDEDPPHNDRGRIRALAHFHPPGRTPEVHVFFEDRPKRHSSRRST